MLIFASCDQSRYLTRKGQFLRMDCLLFTREGNTPYCICAINFFRRSSHKDIREHASKKYISVHSHVYRLNQLAAYNNMNSELQALIDMFVYMRWCHKPCDDWNDKFTRKYIATNAYCDACLKSKWIHIVIEDFTIPLTDFSYVIIRS